MQAAGQTPYLFMRTAEGIARPDMPQAALRDFFCRSAFVCNAASLKNFSDKPPDIGLFLLFLGCKSRAVAAPCSGQGDRITFSVFPVQKRFRTGTEP